MAKDIFISYSRRDQEFVTRLASDLHAQVAGVWFDQATIQAGQKWHDEIMDGIRECKAFVLVLSPDAVESKYVREEVNKALELGKTIFPILYRPGTWTGEFAALVHEVQTLDLRSGSYADNFQKLVDGLIEAGAGKTTGERPFLRKPEKVAMGIVLSKVPGWAFAWSLGWLAFCSIGVLLLIIILLFQNEMKAEYLLDFVIIIAGAVIGGFSGGIFAGTATMLALRPYASSISWRHMSPGIRIWAIYGPAGLAGSGLLTYLLMEAGTIAVQAADCTDLGLGECIGAIAGQIAAFIILAIVVFLILATATWFVIGLFAGRRSVNHIRRLEPGITNSQSRGVSLGWGCGSIVAAVVSLILWGFLLNTLGL